ncbi:MAG: molybdenum ABC transporter ATP-binding protein, partial [Woeseiaceae bacterium]
PIHERGIGYVFQDGRLFPHMNVRDNLLYGYSRAERPTLAGEFDRVASILGIDRLLERAPGSLSGGESQRVAVGRAFLGARKLLLMDEPLASLDAARRREVLPYIDALANEIELPIVYVSHSIDEVCRLADHIVVMDEGRVRASGEPQSVLTRTDLPVIADEEACTVIRASVSDYDQAYDLTRVAISGGEMVLAGRYETNRDRVRVRVRANDVSLCLTQPRDSTILNVLPAVVEEIATRDSAQAMIRLAVGSDKVLARITRRSAQALALQPGIEVFAQIKSVAVR